MRMHVAGQGLASISRRNFYKLRGYNKPNQILVWGSKARAMFAEETWQMFARGSHAEVNASAEAFYCR